MGLFLFDENDTRLQTDGFCFFVLFFFLRISTRERTIRLLL